MASRSFRPPLGTIEVDVVELFVELTIGTSGSLDTASGGGWYGAGIDSVTKESTAGQYTIVLEDSYNRMLWGGITLLDDSDSSAATVAVETRFESEDVDGTSADPNVVIQGYNSDDGAVDDFASGAKVFVCLKLRNSTVEFA